MPESAARGRGTVPQGTMRALPRERLDATPTLPLAQQVALVNRVPQQLRRYASAPQRLRAGTEATLLRGGAETYPAMLAAIHGAQRQILLETYIFSDDSTGRKFASALIQRARDGVDVRIIYDSIGSFSTDEDWFDALRADGLQILEYHPAAPWRARWNLSRRDHRKILVVDDAVAFTGGLNIGDEYACAEDGGKGWHDMHCELRGPVVLDASRMFRKTWISNGGAVYPAPPRVDPQAAAGSGMLAMVLGNGERHRRGVIRAAYVRAIHAARARVCIENAYFLPDRPIRRALARAVRRGVRVEVIVPGVSDIKAVQYAGMYAMRSVSKQGVRVRRWKGVMLHAKIAVIDGVWSVVGTYNLDAQSLLQNLEVVAEVVGPEFGAIVQAQFDEDLLHSEPFDETTWRQLPWWKRFLSRLAFAFRGWL